MSETPRKKVGRPVKPATPGQKMALGLRVTPQIKEALDAAALISGRTQSQEAEHRLERSFDNRPLLAAMELAYGRELGGILIVVGEAMSRTRDTRQTPASAFDDPWLCSEMIKAASLVFEAFRPEGEIVTPDDAGPTVRGPGVKSRRLTTVGRKLEELSWGEFVARLRLLGLTIEQLRSHDSASPLLGNNLVERVTARVK